jgi:hypothetical protein
MYVQRNIEARSLNHCCNGNAMIIISIDSISVPLDIEHAIR